MATVVVFHHAQGLTSGIERFAETLRSAGHVVHVPDLYEGRTFPTVDDGVAHAEEIGFDEIRRRGARAVEGLPSDVVYAGFSLGLLPAEELTITRAGATGALLYHDAIPPEAFGGVWPDGVPVQIHVMEDDPWAETDAVRAFEANVEGCEAFIYPGSSHLFADDSVDDYDPAAAALLVERTLAFLSRIG